MVTIVPAFALSDSEMANGAINRGEPTGQPRNTESPSQPRGGHGGLLVFKYRL